ncbi:alkaline phosphatase family protein [Thermodesulfatator indicus]
MKKLILISIDGFRPELIDKKYCQFLHSLSKNSHYSNNVQSVIPPITLPCFYSIFFGVNPLTHGVFYNIIHDDYNVNSPNLFEILSKNNFSCSAYFNWKTLEKAFGHNNNLVKYFIDDLTINGDIKMVSLLLENIKSHLPDFIFLYLGALDEVGHKYKWMSKEYIETAKTVDKLVKILIESLGETYDFIIHSDHGGYEYGHYVLMKEIMTVPLIFFSRNFNNIEFNKKVGIIDIAPTILNYFGIDIPINWEGTPFIYKIR